MEKKNNAELTKKLQQDTNEETKTATEFFTLAEKDYENRNFKYLLKSFSFFKVLKSN